MIFPVPLIIFPIKTSEASIKVALQFNVAAHGKGLLTYYGVFGAKSYENAELIAAFKDLTYLGGIYVKSQWAWTLLAP